MFCQNCGTKNNDTSIFCENCGARLEKPVQQAPQVEQVQEQPVESVQEQPVESVQEQPVERVQEQPVESVQEQPMQEQPTQQAPTYQQTVQGQPTQQEPVYQQPMQQVKPKKKVSKSAIVIAVEVVALLALIVAAFKIGENAFSAEKVAEKFFVEVANQNYKEAYKILDIDESEFINEENFKNASCNMALDKVSKYEVRKSSDDDDEKTVKIKYKGKSGTDTYVINVEKKDGKKFLLFDNWEVNADSMIAKDFTLYVPNGAKVTVDGIELGDKYVESEDTYGQTYVIPKIFAGEHQVVVSQEGMQEVRKIVDTDDGSFYVDQMSPGEEVLAEITDIATEDFKLIFEAAAERKDFSEIKSLLSSDEDYLEALEDDYDNLVQQFETGGYETINKVQFSNIKTETDEGYLTSADYGVEVYITFDYYIEYTDSWFDEISHETYDGDTYAYFEFVCEDGEWVLADMSGLYLYFY